MRIVTVLRSGGDYSPMHVQALQKQLARWAPLATFECLSDLTVPGVVTTPLTCGWPGWWSKMELFRPDIAGDFLFMDLDTVISGSLSDVLAIDKLTLLRDFYRDGKKLKEGLQSSLMFLPKRDRYAPWEDFTSNPALSMRLYARGGDQALLEAHFLNTAKRWQDVVPGQVVSWKVNCQNGVPPDARIVCMHGKPRPWAVPQFLHLYR